MMKTCIKPGAFVLATVAFLLLLVCCAKDEMGKGRPDFAGIPEHANIPDHVTLPEATGVNRINDIDGNVYPIVQIGEQWWMAENLKTTHYNDGAPIEYFLEEGEFDGAGTFLWYNDDYEVYGSVYGALYNKDAVQSGKLCPTGWHVPDDDEWLLLTNNLGGSEIAGGKMKTTGTIEDGTGLWYAPNTGATNESGWSGLPGGGFFGSKGDGGKLIPGPIKIIEPFDFVGGAGYWWSRTDPLDNSSPLTALYYNSSQFGIDQSSEVMVLVKPNHSSVRCVKD